MRQRISFLFLLFNLLVSSALAPGLSAQEPSSDVQPAPSIPPPVAAAASTPASTLVPPNGQLIVPAGTRIPLILRNPINTRTAKPGDSVYFETAYPIAVNNRTAIPMSAFMRGQILEAKRPGRIKGRGEIRMALEQLTFPNGYTIALLASPSSVDPNTGAGVDSTKRIVGSSSALRDTTAVLGTTAAGAYIGSIAGAVSNDAPGRGALIGGGVGGLGALIAVLATRGPEAQLPRGTMLDVVFDRPLILDAAYVPANGGPGIDPQPRYLPPPVEARESQRERQRRHAGLPGLLPFLFLPLLR
jgi:hypothetical protein